MYTVPRKLQTSILSLSKELHLISTPVALPSPEVQSGQLRRQDWARSVSGSNASDFF